jgi:hypothetical protein
MKYEGRAGEGEEGEGRDVEVKRRCCAVRPEREGEKAVVGTKRSKVRKRDETTSTPFVAFCRVSASAGTISDASRASQAVSGAVERERREQIDETRQSLRFLPFSPLQVAPYSLPAPPRCTSSYDPPFKC